MKDKWVLPQETYAKFYDEVLRPSMVTCDPEAVDHWDASYQTAFDRAHAAGGHVRMHSKEISGPTLEVLGPVLMEKLQAIHEFRGAFFYHELRGVKGATSHDGTQAAERDAAYREFTSFLTHNFADSGTWLIDVAVEVHQPNHVIQWITDRHYKILRLVLPSAPADRVITHADNASFTRDYSAQLYNLGGFRDTLKALGAADGVHHINVYTTDKEQHYQLHRGYYRKHFPSELLDRDLMKSLLGDMQVMMNTLRECAGVGNDHVQSAAARLEIRVTPNKARNVLDTLSTEFVNETCVAIPAALWW